MLVFYAEIIISLIIRFSDQIPQVLLDTAA